MANVRGGAHIVLVIFFPLVVSRGKAPLAASVSRFLQSVSRRPALPSGKSRRAIIPVKRAWSLTILTTGVGRATRSSDEQHPDWTIDAAACFERCRSTTAGLDRHGDASGNDRGWPRSGGSSGGGVGYVNEPWPTLLTNVGPLAERLGLSAWLAVRSEARRASGERPTRRRRRQAMALTPARVRRKRYDSVPVSMMCARSVSRSTRAWQRRGLGKT